VHTAPLLTSSKHQNGHPHGDQPLCAYGCNVVCLWIAACHSSIAFDCWIAICMIGEMFSGLLEFGECALECVHGCAAVVCELPHASRRLNLTVGLPYA
jgi:hypothetical protein